MEPAEANIGIKVKLLEMTVTRNSAVVNEKQSKVIKRHVSTLSTLHVSGRRGREINNKRRARCHTSRNGTPSLEQNWKTEADTEVEKVTTWLDDRRKEKEAHAQEHFEAKLHQTKLDMQTELQGTQTSQKPSQVQTPGNIQAKLPKLMILLHGQTEILGTI